MSVLKKFLSMSAAIVAVGLFAGCAGNSNTPPTPTASATESATSPEFEVPKLVNVVGSVAVDATGAAVNTVDIEEIDVPRVEVVFDLQCPWCSLVDTESREDWKSKIENKDAQFFFTPVSFLDRVSPDAYSSRSGSALLEVSETDPESFLNFLQALMENQPAEGQSVSDESIQEVARNAGVSEEAVERIPEYRFQDFVKANAEYVDQARPELFENGLTTPTVVVGGFLSNTGELVEFERVNYGKFDNIVDDFNTVYAKFIEG